MEKKKLNKKKRKKESSSRAKARGAMSSIFETLGVEREKKKSWQEPKYSLPLGYREHSQNRAQSIVRSRESRKNKTV